MSWLTAYWQTLSPLEQVLYVLLMCAAELWWLRKWFPLPGSRAKRAARQRAATVARFSGEADRRNLRSRLAADVSERRRQTLAPSPDRVVATTRTGEYANTTSLRMIRKDIA